MKKTLFFIPVLAIVSIVDFQGAIGSSEISELVGTEVVSSNLENRNTVVVQETVTETVITTTSEEKENF